MSVAQVITDACKNAQYEASKLSQDAERSNSANDEITIIEAISEAAGMTVDELLDDIVVHGFGEL